MSRRSTVKTIIRPNFALLAPSLALSLALLIACFTGFASLANAVDNCYNAGVNPRPICTCLDLNQSRHPTANYSLQNDVDCSATPTWNSGAGFQPIGNDTSRFAGNFFGNGFKITDLWINRSSTNVGLFSYTTTGANFSNLGLTNASVNGSQYVGVLAGYAANITMQNCYVTGNINASNANSYAGLFAGSISAGYVNYSYVNGNVTGRSYLGGFFGSAVPSSTTNLFINNSNASATIYGSQDLGGLIGSVASSGGSGFMINNSFTAGSVNGTGFLGGVVGWSWESSYYNVSSSANVYDRSNGGYDGGLIGRLFATSILALYDSYATGNVTSVGGSYVGGLVGSLERANTSRCFASGQVSALGRAGGFAGAAVAVTNFSIDNCYARGNTTVTGGGANEVGGFIGYTQTVTIRNSYSTGAPLGASIRKGGFIGYNSTTTGVAINSSYWDNQTSGITTSPKGTPATTAQMKDAATFTNVSTAFAWDFAGNPYNDTSNSSYWFIYSAFNDGYPYLPGVGYPSIPIVNVTYPVAGRNYSSVQYLNYTVLYPSGGNDSCWYSNNSGAWNSTPVAAGTNFTLNQPDGTNNLTVYCNDSYGVTIPANVTFYLDSTPPSNVTYVNPTPLNASTRAVNYSFVNASFNETNPNNCILNYIYPNSTNTNLSMTLVTGANPYCYFNVTMQPDGEANFTVYVNDSVGNLGSNLTQYGFRVDTPPYGVTYVSPTPSNGSWRNYNYSFVNATFTETYPDSCLLDYVYSNSTNANLTMTLFGAGSATPYCEFNVTSQPEGEANFTLYVNDSAGSWGSNLSHYEFNIDKTAPSNISYADPTPLNASYRAVNYSFVNASFNETNPSECFLNYVYPNSTNVNLSMTLTTGANPYCEFNVTNQTQGQANFTVYVNDSAGNLGANTTYYYFVVDTAPPYFDSNLTPEEGNTSYSTAQTFSFTAYSYASSTLNCSLIVDGATAATNESTANATPTTLNATLAVGTHAWNVSCAGGAGNSNSTDTRNITILQESTGSQSVGGRFIPSPSPSPPTPSPTTAILTPTATPRASPQPPRASVQPTVPTTVKPPASNEEQEESWWPATREGTARGISVVQETIKIADSKNMDVDEAKRLVALAQHALDRGDYAAASEYLKQSEDALRKAGVSVSHPPSTKNAGFDWQTAGAAAAAIAVAAAAAGALLYLRRKREL